VKAPLISVIVPVWNGARFLAESLDSILAQQHRPLEILVVDDGSEDDSASIAERYGEPVRVLRQSHRGPAAARNTGITAARGELLAFNDCDDLWLPQKLMRQLEFLTARPDIDMCLTWAQNFWEEELAEDAAAYADHPMSKPYGGYSIQSLLMRAAAARRAPLLPEHLRHGETAVWIESARAAGLTVEELREVLVRRRLHRGNMTRLEVGAAAEGVFHFLQTRLRTRRSQPS